MEALPTLSKVSWKPDSSVQEAALSYLIFDQISLILLIVCCQVHWGRGQLVQPYAHCNFSDIVT